MNRCPPCANQMTSCSDACFFEKGEGRLAFLVVHLIFCFIRFSASFQTCAKRGSGFGIENSSLPRTEQVLSIVCHGVQV